MSFVDFVTTFLRRVISHPGFLSSDVTTQQQIHHLTFICSLVRDSGHGLEVILEENKLIQV